MRTLLITTMAVGLIGCATQPKVVLRVVDPYSLIVYDLTDKPCPVYGNYPFVFQYQGKIEGCYRMGSDAIYFISSHDWRTQVKYTIGQLVESKRAYESNLGYALQNVKPSYAPSVPNLYNPPSQPLQSPIQCFTNGFGTVTCN
jgi:hypothetical protein